MRTMREDSNPSLDKTYTLGEAIYNNMEKPADFVTYRIYDEDYDCDPPPDVIPCHAENVINAWEQDFGMVTWMTHGSWNVATDVLDSRWYLPMLIDEPPSFVFQGSCHNGHIYLPDCYPACQADVLNYSRPDGRISLGYLLLKEHTVATVSSTEVSRTLGGGEFIPGVHDQYNSGLLNESFGYLYTNEIISNRSTAGNALKNIKYSHFGSPASQSITYHQQLIYNLYGDPSLRLIQETWFVDGSVTSSGNGSSWEEAFKTLQEALFVAGGGDEIRVAEGIYKPDEGGMYSPGDRDATFQLKNGVVILGGYAGYGAPDPNKRDFIFYETILSGDLNRDDGPNFINYDENSRHVVTGSGTDFTAILDGFTISSGNANDIPYPAHSGGGMYNYFGSPTVKNCRFKKNLAESRGGGIFTQEGIPIITNCFFEENAAENAGGGIYNGYSASPIVKNCTFYKNTAKSLGGAICNVYSSNPTLINCTLSMNDAGDGGGAMSCYASTPTLINCILWENVAPVGPEVFLDYSNINISYCNINQDGYEGINGNIRQDPLFVDPENGDFHLQNGSPCIDAGIGENTPEHDCDSESRPFDVIGVNNNGIMPDFDIGADEFVDSYPPLGNGCADLYECEGNFDGDQDQDGSDAARFKTDFGRSRFLNPCRNSSQCNGDFDCDEDVDGTDAALFKEDFGRSPFNNPCPVCTREPWCTYP